MLECRDLLKSCKYMQRRNDFEKKSIDRYACVQYYISFPQTKLSENFKFKYGIDFFDIGI